MQRMQAMQRTKTVRRHLAGTAGLLLAVGVAVTATPADAGAPVAAGAAPAAAADAEYGRLMLVLDSSGSMAEPAGGGQTKIRAARTALGTVVDELPEQAQVGLRVFGSEVFSRNDAGACEDTELIVPPGTGNRAELRAAVKDYEPYGETPIPIALEKAADDLGDEGARSIVLVSDGESTCGDPCDVAKRISNNGIDLQIDVVGLSVSSAARRQLECIARAGHGTYYDADSAEDIQVHVTRVAERALRPFALNGAPIEGGPEDAPTPITVGDWTDTLDVDDPKSYLFERTTAGTTLRVAAITQGASANAESLTTSIYAPDGSRCDYSIAYRGLDVRDIIGSGATAWAENECDQPGQYRIEVNRSQATKGAAAVGLRVTEEPPVVDAGVDAGGPAEATPPTVSGGAQDVVGGAAFDNAPELTTGKWSSTIVPGEAQLFAVPLEFGQSARISVRFPRLSGALADVYGLNVPLAQVGLYNPMHAALEPPTGGQQTGKADDNDLVTAIAPVSRAGATAPSYPSGGGDTTVSGDYYLGVSARAGEAKAELPYTIEVEIVGDPAEGPTYADDATWTVADGLTDDGDDETATEDPSGSPTATDSGGDQDSESDDGDAADADGSEGSGTAIAVVLGAVGLAALAAALLLWRRRAAATRAG